MILCGSESRVTTDKYESDLTEGEMKYLRKFIRMIREDKLQN